MAIRAKAFGMKVLAQDIYWPEAFAEEHHITRIEHLDRLFSDSDFISLHTNLTAETQGLINSATIQKMKNSAILINCGRGELVHVDDILAALRDNTLGGYGADVLDVEPANADHPLLSAPSCLITPHIGSRTHESVIRQATKATENLLMLLRGESPHAQVNNCLPPKALI